MKSPRNSTPRNISRRSLLKSLSFTPILLRSAPIYPFYLPGSPENSGFSEFPLADLRLSPHYPAESPLSDIFRMVPPGSDEYPLEQFAVEIESVLEQWGKTLRTGIEHLGSIASHLDDQIEASDLGSATQT